MDDERNRSGRERDLRPMVSTSVIQAFVAGLVLGNLNKTVLLGFAIGALGGAFIQQNLPGVPDVNSTWKDFMKRWSKSTGGSNSNR